MQPIELYFIMVFAVNLVLGISIFLTNRSKPINQHYLLLCIITTIWLFFSWNALISTQPQQAKFFIQLTSAVAIFIPASCHLLRLAIINPNDPWWRGILRIKTQILFCFVVAALCFSPFYITKVEFPPTSSGIVVPEPSHSWVMFIFAGYLLFQIGLLLSKFPKDRLQASGSSRIELEFITLGYIASLMTGAVGGLIGSLLTRSSANMPWMNATSLLVLIIIISYGITTRRILGIATLLQRAAAYLFLGIYLIFVYYLTFHVSLYILNLVDAHHPHLAYMLAAITVALSMIPAKGRFQMVANRLIRSSTMNVPSTMKQANAMFQSVSTIDALLNQFSSLLKQELGAYHILIFTQHERVLRQCYPEPENGPLIELTPDSPICQTLEKKCAPLCLDIISRSKPTDLLRAAEQQLISLEANTVVGIFSKAKLSGLVILGPRAGGRIYDRSEQDAVQLLCNQFAVALDNARMYTEMQDSKIRNEIMLDQLVSGVIVAGPDRKITLFNHEAQRITGIQESEAIGKDIIILPLPLFQALDLTLSSRLGKRNVDAQLLHLDQEETSASIRMGSSYLYGHDNSAMGALLVLTDVTELKALEEQVRRTDQLSSVGTLAAGMAHEIKNPLVTIKTFTQLLPQRYADDDFRNDFSTLVAHEVSRIDGIVNELLSFSKPAKPNLIPMNLQETVEQTLKLIQEQMAQNNITLDSTLAAESDMILGDAKLLSQALINLNLNAIEAIGNHGTITVNTSNCMHRFAGDRTGQVLNKYCIRLQISDTGEGIKEENLQQIFDPFYTSKSSGTGMGLSVSHGIINEHNAVIEIESTPKQGTTFFIFFPVLKEEKSK